MKIELQKHRIKKIMQKFSFVISIILCSHVAYAQNHYINPLFDYVIKKEAEFKALIEKRNNLWKKCACKLVQSKVERNFFGDIQIITITKYVVRACATQEDMRDLFDITQRLSNFKEMVQADLAQMQSQGLNINDKNKAGNSPLHYASSHLMYNSLREQGVEFAWMPFLYKYRYFSGMAAIFCAYIAYMGYYPHLIPFTTIKDEANKTVKEVDLLYGGRYVFNFFAWCALAAAGTLGTDSLLEISNVFDEGIENSLLLEMKKLI